MELLAELLDPFLSATCDVLRSPQWDRSSRQSPSVEHQWTHVARLECKLRREHGHAQGLAEGLAERERLWYDSAWRMMGKLAVLCHFWKDAVLRWRLTVTTVSLGGVSGQPEQIQKSLRIVGRDCPVLRRLIILAECSSEGLMPVFRKCSELRAIEAFQTPDSDIEHALWSMVVGSPLIDSLYLPSARIFVWPPMDRLINLVVGTGTVAMLEILARNAPMLRNLRVAEMSSTEAECTSTPFSKLETFHIENYDDGEDGGYISRMPYMPRLLSLTLSIRSEESIITHERAIIVRSKSPILQQCSLLGSWRVHGSELLQVAELLPFTEIDFGEITGGTDFNKLALAASRHLVAFSYDHADLTDSTVQHLANACPLLCRLNLYHRGSSLSRLTDAGLHALQHGACSQSLRVLDLQGNARLTLPAILDLLENTMISEMSLSGDSTSNVLEHLCLEPAFNQVHKLMWRNQRRHGEGTYV